MGSTVVDGTQPRSFLNSRKQYYQALGFLLRRVQKKAPSSARPAKGNKGKPSTAGRRRRDGSDGASPVPQFGGGDGPSPPVRDAAARSGRRARSRGDKPVLERASRFVAGDRVLATWAGAPPEEGNW